MTIHSLYVFSKGGSCLYYTEWYRPRSTLSEYPEEDRKLMFGLLFSLKQLMNKMQPMPLDGASSASGGSGGPLFTGSSDSSGASSAGPALPPTGPDQGFFRALWHLYSEIFIGYALKNPLYRPGTPIECVGFISETDRFIRSLPAFTVKAG